MGSMMSYIESKTRYNIFMLYLANKPVYFRQQSANAPSVDSHRVTDLCCCIPPK